MVVCYIRLKFCPFLHLLTQLHDIVSCKCHNLKNLHLQCTKKTPSCLPQNKNTKKHLLSMLLFCFFTLRHCNSLVSALLGMCILPKHASCPMKEKFTRQLRPKVGVLGTSTIIILAVSADCNKPLVEIDCSIAACIRLFKLWKKKTSFDILKFILLKYSVLTLLGRSV